MAQAKVTIESLTQMAEILRQSADDILGTKEQMDNELYNIPWDDPIGLTFISKYEEDFKPLKEKLIPNINNYIQYMKDEGLVVSEYSGESIGGLGVIGAAGAGAAGAGAAGAGAKGKGATSNGSKDSHDKKKSEKRINEFLVENKDGTILWNDNRFKRLEEENAAYLKSEDGEKMQERAKEAFSKIDDLSTLTKEQLHQIVGGTLGLKEGEIEYYMAENNNPNTLGWHPWDSKEAILNENQRATMPVCEQIATFAHEGRHVYQDMVINSSSDDVYAEKMRFGRTVYKSAKEDYQKYYHNPLEFDARRIEIIVGKTCSERYNELIKMKLIKPRRWNPSDY